MIALLFAAPASRGPGEPPALVLSPDQISSAADGQLYDALITVTQNATPVGQTSVSRAGLPPGLTVAFHI